MLLPISQGVVLHELEAVKAMADKWIQVFQKEIPGVEKPEKDEGELEMLIRNFCAEMYFASDKCESLSRRMMTDLISD